jgi:tRNA pseudouridine55 synthase
MRPPELLGFLNVDKPRGWTSRQAVDHVKRLVRPAKVGHAGTLDPLASGVLIVCVGKATRLVPYLHELPKAYRAEFLLGRESDTDDTDGDVKVLDDAPPVTRAQLLEVLPRFRGRIWQRPPAYSAVKIGGQRAYDLARRGQVLEIEPREVDVFRIELTDFDPPRFALDIECSTGTYLRSLGRDIAQAVGSCAVMSGLVRTRIGEFHLRDALAPEQITRESVAEQIVPALAAVAHLPAVACDRDMLEEFSHGRSAACPPEVVLKDGELGALLTIDGQLAGIAEFQASERRLAPRRIFL